MARLPWRTLGTLSSSTWVGGRAGIPIGPGPAGPLMAAGGGGSLVGTFGGGGGRGRLMVDKEWQEGCRVWRGGALLNIALAYNHRLSISGQGR